MSEIQRQPASPPVAPPAALTQPRLWPTKHILLLLGFWLAIFAASLSTPPLLDDADATHAQAAQAMLNTGDWVTLHVDGIRYLEKPPLPYWLAAISLRLFGTSSIPGDASSFAIHLPGALAVLALALLGYTWSRRAFSERAALYTGLFTLTAIGVFLFTRIFIPDVLLSLFLCIALYALLRALDAPPTPSTTPGATPFHAYLFWVCMALAVLTKGLVAIVFLLGTAILYLALTQQLHNLRRLKPFTGLLLFLAIAAPWHILAGLRNTGGANNHGFFWFYFVNEHYLRFLGRRIPRDYNKLPTALYWSLHLVWLFPWSLFAPAAILFSWRKRREIQRSNDLNANGERLSRLELLARRQPQRTTTFASQTVLLLSLFSAFVLLFFSLSTNQEYYTFPVYLPLLMLLAAALAAIETRAPDRTMQRALTFTYAAFTFIGFIIAAALAYGLWTSRTLPFVSDIGSLLAHRNVGNYTLSMSHFFDLTGPSFAALRLPTFIAAMSFAFGPALAWFLHTRRKPLASMLTIALTSATFLIAAHIALIRFSPMLSSQSFVATIQRFTPDTEVLIYGDQAFGSSIPFYLNRRVDLVDGRSTSMLFGSTFPDAPPIFITHTQLLAQWGTGPRKLLFVPLEKRDEVDHLLGSHQIILQETSGKALITDRPLNKP
jgi:4-amino-4-deoxy-L-arabinose transferase-like glycosyltransferase